MKEASNKIISIIVVTRGIEDYLKLCLDSLKKQIYAASEIIVIDNSLNPDFSREISSRYPEIRLFSSSKNLFYCAGLNSGIEASKGDFLLCLNDDVILDKKFIAEALKAFSIDEKIGMVTGKVLRSDAKTIDSTGLFLSICCTAKERGYGVKDKGQYEKEEYIFGVNGAAAFYRRRMLEDIKIDADYFDTDYHIFYEDLDVAWRAKRSGWKGYYVPRAVAYHFRGGTVRPGYAIGKPYARRYLSDDLHLDLLKNRYLTLIKNASFFGFLLHLPFILFYELLAWGYILIFRPRLIKKFILNLKILKPALEKRKLIKKRERLQKILDKNKMLW